MYYLDLVSASFITNFVEVLEQYCLYYPVKVYMRRPLGVLIALLTLSSFHHFWLGFTVTEICISILPHYFLRVLKKYSWRGGHSHPLPIVRPWLEYIQSGKRLLRCYPGQAYAAISVRVHKESNLYNSFEIPIFCLFLKKKMGKPYFTLLCSSL